MVVVAEEIMPELMELLVPLEVVAGHREVQLVALQYMDHKVTTGGMEDRHILEAVEGEAEPVLLVPQVVMQVPAEVGMVFYLI